MKLSFLFLAFLLLNPIFAQNEYFTISKNGECFKKPVYYIMESDFVKITKEDSKTVFLTSKNSFVYDSDKHNSFLKERHKIPDSLILKINQLYKKEKDFFNEVKKNKSNNERIVIPPIDHTLLKIFILYNENEEFYKVFEVEWEE